MQVNREAATLTGTVVYMTAYAEWLEQVKTITGVEIEMGDMPWPDKLAEVSEKGKLFKRIEDWLYKDKGVKLYSQDRQMLSNNLYKSLVFPGLVCSVDNRFDWQPGDFADGKSCFWGGKRQAWFFLNKLGGAAFKASRDGKGVGRCLMLPYAGDPECPIMFNAYGMALPLLTITYAALYAPADSGTIRSALLSVDGKVNKPVHINDSGGYVVGATDGEVVATDLNAQEYFDHDREDYYTYCELCYNQLDLNNGVRDHRGRGDHYAYICQDCYDNRQTFKDMRKGYDAGPRYRNVILMVYARRGEHSRNDRHSSLTSNTYGTWDGTTTSSSTSSVRFRVGDGALPPTRYTWANLLRRTRKADDEQKMRIWNRLAHLLDTATPTDVDVASQFKAMWSYTLGQDTLALGRDAILAPADVPRCFGFFECMVAVAIYHAAPHCFVPFLAGLVGWGGGRVVQPVERLRSMWLAFFWNGTDSSLVRTTLARELTLPSGNPRTADIEKAEALIDKLAPRPQYMTAVISHIDKIRFANDVLFYGEQVWGGVWQEDEYGLMQRTEDAPEL